MKKIFVVVLVLLILVPAIMAKTVDLTVETDYPFRYVVLKMFSANGGNFIGTEYPGKTDLHGTLNGNLTTDSSSLNIVAYVIENGDALVKQEFNNVKVGSKVFLDMSTEEDENIFDDNEQGDDGQDEDNSTEEGANTTLTGEGNTGEDYGEITGAVVDDSSSSVSIIFYYVLGVLLLAGIIGFVVGKMVRTRRTKMGYSDPRDRKMPNVPEPKPVESVGSRGDMTTEARIAEAERKIREAQQELNKMRNQERIKSAEEKLRKDQEELERLRRDEN